MAWHKLGVGVSNRHDWLAEFVLLGAGCAPQGTRARCLAANGGYCRAQRKHGVIILNLYGVILDAFWRAEKVVNAQF